MDGEARNAGASAPAVARLGLAAALAMLALAFAGGAQADLTAPTITLGTVSILDGTISLTGSVDEAGADANLQINGRPVDVGTHGNFSAVVDLEGDHKLVLTLTGQNESAKITIPLSVLETEGDGALDELSAAGIAIDVPQGGFKIVDGNQPLVTGAVANEEELQSLTVNGVDVLDRLGPGGSFALMSQRRASSGAGGGVTVVANDTRGVSQTSIFSTSRVTSVIRTRAGASVSTAGARGILIAKVRFQKGSMKTMKRVGVVVTVKDRRGLLIRGAALQLSGKPLRYLVNGSARAGFTNRFGQARFTYRLHSRAFATCGCTQLAITVRASTPSAAAKKKALLRLPARARA